MKDEAHANPTYGGNKVRKLAHLLADAEDRGATDLVTFGALGSHHVLATALLGAERGLRTHAVLVPQPDTPHVHGTLARTEAACASVVRVGGDGAAVVAASRVVAGLRLRGRTPRVVPVGGSSPVGVQGWIDGALELCGQVARGELPAPRRIVVALGSGGTAAGLVAGLALGGLDAEVVGVRVAPTWLANLPRVRSLARRALALRGATAHAGRLRVDQGWFRGGYGCPDPEVERACALGRDLGLPLETTYTARAFGACLEQQGAGPVLFLQTASA